MHWLEREVRKTSLKQLLICVGIVAVVASVLAVSQRYLSNYFAGPYDMPVAELVAVKDAAAVARYWITTTPERVLDTDIDHVTVTQRRHGTTSRSVTGRYHAGVYGEHLLLIKADAGVKPSGTLEGALVAMPRDLVAMATLRLATQLEVRPDVLPVVLDASNFRLAGDVGLAIAAGAILLALGFGAAALRRHSTPSGHPALVKLAVSGSEPLAQAAANIEADFKGNQVVWLSGHQLAGTHLLKTGGFKFDARSLDDLVWAYAHMTKKKHWGFIPAGETHAAVLYFRRGKVSIGGQRTNVQNAMQFLAIRAPWAFVGYDDNIAAAMKARAADVHAVVDQRKAHLAAVAGQTPGSPIQSA